MILEAFGSLTRYQSLTLCFFAAAAICGVAAWVWGSLMTILEAAHQLDIRGSCALLYFLQK